MYKISPIAVLISTLFPLSVIAQSIEGDVKNNDGMAVYGAKIRVEGTDINALTDKNGHFVLRDLNAGKNEFHISAPGFAHVHQEVTLSNDEIKKLSLTLIRSPIEVIDVTAAPIHMSVMESASPVSVLSGETLRRQQAATLGDSLEKLAGVHTNFHANVASTPIIRGLSGPRVLIAQNGLDVSDVSRVGPDHSVASEASTAQQIEVLRGPATLFYGSGAIGGVVNVVDERVPTDNTTHGEWLLQNSSVNNQKLASFNATTGFDSFGFYVDGYWRESDDYEVPVDPESDHDEHDEAHEDHGFVVDNSAEESNGFTLGTSYLFDEGYVGVSVEQFNREYGIPGHSHGDERVYADLDQTRIQVLSEINIDSDYIKKINFRSGITDYQHTEIEGGETGTTFENKTDEVKLDILHTPFSDWHGGLSLHFKNSEVEAQGEEAFTPPSKSKTIAIALMEEKKIGDVLFQFGGRVERVTLKASDVLLPSIEGHVDEEDDHGHDHEHDEEVTDIRVFSVDHEFTPVSVSAGLVWDFSEDYNLGLSISRSQRAPSASELLSFGAHIGTGTYEVGALFALHEEDGDAHIGLSEENIDLETANNIDLTFRKKQGDIGFVFNAFYNQVDNYYYQTSTGLSVESRHDHDHGEDEHSDEEESSELPVYIFQTDDVILHGFEMQVAWQLTDTFKATVFSDYVRARLKDGGSLPRTPPLRFGTQFSYENEQLSAHLDITRYDTQDRIASDETETDGYTLVDASVSYDIQILNHDMSFYLQGSNLTNTEARVHTSLLKDIAPRPGRSITIGVRSSF